MTTSVSGTRTTSSGNRNRRRKTVGELSPSQCVSLTRGRPGTLEAQEQEACVEENCIVSRDVPPAENAMSSRG